MSARAGAPGVGEPGIVELEAAPPASAAAAASPRRMPARLPQAAKARSRLAGLLPFAAIAAALETRRLFILLPFAMVAGLVLYAGLPVEPAPWAMAAIAVVPVVVIPVSLAHMVRLRLAVLFAAFWAGFCLLPVHGALQGTDMLAFPLYGTYQARVDEILVEGEGQQRRIVVSHLVPVGHERDAIVTRARLSLAPDPPLAPGDIIEADLRLAPVPGPILPGAFDSQFHAFFAGIGAFGNETGALRLVSSGSDADPIRAMEGLRDGIADRIDAVLDGDAAAMGIAMVVGDQSAITDEAREVMAASGLAHIYSISGLHLSIVAGGVFFLLRLGLASLSSWTQTWPVKKIAALSGILTACFYLLLAGGFANVPALRSTIMLGLIFGAVLAGRRALTMRNVAIAALAIIIIDPASVFRASFQLSFAAVVGLIGIYELPRQQREGDSSWGERLLRHIWLGAVTSLIAGAATLLFSAYHFQQTAPLGVVGNVLVLPLVSFVIMPAALLSVLAMPLGFEVPFVSVMGWGIDRMVQVAHLVTAWSQGLEGNPLLAASALLIGLAALAWFAFVQNYWRLAGPALAIPAIVLFGLDQRPDILIADSTQAVVLRSDAGLGMVAGRTGTFATDVWSEHYREEIAPSLDIVRCDSLACVATTERFSVSVVKGPDAFFEDCARNDLVIARIPAPASCRDQAQLIDGPALAAGGVHWLKWDEAAKAFAIRPAIANITRPWRAEQR